MLIAVRDWCFCCGLLRLRRPPLGPSHYNLLLHINIYNYICKKRIIILILLFFQLFFSFFHNIDFSFLWNDRVHNNTLRIYAFFIPKFCLCLLYKFFIYTQFLFKYNKCLKKTDKLGGRGFCLHRETYTICFKLLNFGFNSIFLNDTHILQGNVFVLLVFFF